MKFLENDLAALKIILTSWSRVIAIVILTGFLTYLYFILTAVYLPEYQAFNVSVSSFNIIMLILISLLSALLLVTFSYSFKVVPISFTGILGMILSFLTTSCGCQSLWLLSLGVALPVFSFFARITNYIQVITVILLLISLHINLNKILSCNRRN